VVSPFAALGCSLALLAGGLAHPVAHPVKPMRTVFQDDAVFLHRSPAQIRGAARQLRALGANILRVTAGWSVLAPAPHARHPPGPPFDPTDSRTYPQAGWRALDRAVRIAHAAGLSVEIDIAFWAPRWAVARGGGNPRRERYRPDPRAFGAFARAVARRYSGHFRPRGSRRPLPAVHTYTPWNEPNKTTFLEPQWTRDPTTGDVRPASPHVYRPMYRAAYRAIKAVDPRDRVLLGGIASLGSPTPGTGGVPPLAFVRALACVDDHLQPLPVPACAHYRPLHADGFATHPYSPGMPPDTSAPLPGDVPLADTARLTALLGALKRRGRIVGAVAVHDTEYGYQTDPPDPYQRYTPLQAAQFEGWAAYLAWRDPHTVTFAHFLMRDLPGDRMLGPPGSPAFWSSYQTGLKYAGGAPKPALAAFALPLWAWRTHDPAGRRAVMVFGDVRPGHGAQTVQVQRRAGADRPWVPVAAAGSGAGCAPATTTLRTDRTGVLLARLPNTGPASYRLAWRAPGGRLRVGVPVPVGPTSRSPVIAPRP
jgi:hypothetical protein